MAITAIFDVRIKAEAVATAGAVITDTLTATRAFPGCRGVEVVIDSADETHVVLIEHWDSLEADSAYRTWRATPEGASSLRDIIAGSPVVTTFADHPEI